MRLWVQQRSDGGFWEVRGTGAPLSSWLQDHPPSPPHHHQQQQKQQQAEEVAVLAGADGRASDRRSCPYQSSSTPTPRVDFGGVRLSSVSNLPVEQIQQLSMFAWGSASGGPGCGPPGQAGAGDGAEAAEPAAAAAADDENFESIFEVLASGMGAAKSNDGAAGAGPEKLMVVFLKTLGLGNAGEQRSTAAAGAGAGAGAASVAAAGVARKQKGKGGSCGDGGTGPASDQGALPAYLTHAVLRKTSPLRSLFELTAELLQDGTAPEDLEAHIEDLPWAWQGAALKDSDCSAAGRLSGGAAPAGASAQRRRRSSQGCRRFLACPPAVAAAASASGRRGQGQDKPSATLTLKEAGLTSGASICFFRAGRESAARKAYGDIVEGLVSDMRLLLKRKGPLGRVHHIKVNRKLPALAVAAMALDSCLPRRP